MNTVNYLFQCGNCGCKFKAPEIPEYSYGLFVLRSEKSETIAFLDARNDQVFAECYEIVKTSPLLSGSKAEKRAEIQQRVFGITCDSPAGETLKIGIPPKCPNCHSSKILSRQQITPIEPLLIPIVQHSEWNLKSYREKSEMLHQQILRCL